MHAPEPGDVFRARTCIPAVIPRHTAMIHFELSAPGVEIKLFVTLAVAKVFSPLCTTTSQKHKWRPSRVMRESKVTRSPVAAERMIDT